jgi:hypothetical protein
MTVLELIDLRGQCRACRDGERLIVAPRRDAAAASGDTTPAATWTTRSRNMSSWMALDDRLDNWP